MVVSGAHCAAAVRARSYAATRAVTTAFRARRSSSFSRSIAASYRADALLLRADMYLAETVDLPREERADFLGLMRFRLLVLQSSAPPPESSSANLPLVGERDAEIEEGSTSQALRCADGDGTLPRRAARASACSRNLVRAAAASAGVVVVVLTISMVKSALAAVKLLDCRQAKRNWPRASCAWRCECGRHNNVQHAMNFRFKERTSFFVSS